MIVLLMFLFVIGAIIPIIGVVSDLLVGVINLPTPPFIMINIFAVAFCLAYALLLERHFVRLYNKFQVKYKTLSLKEKLYSRSVIITLMVIQCNAVLFLTNKLEHNIGLSFLIISALSMIFGIVIKQWQDSLHEISRVPITARD